MNNSYYLIPFILFLVISCEEDRILNSMNMECRVKTMKDSTGNILQSYTYDEQGRIIKWEGRNKNIYSYYYYETGRAIEITSNDDGTLDSIIYILNPGGNAIRTEFKGSPGTLTLYEYNNEGYMIRNESITGFTKDTTVSNFFYKNNNCVFTTFYDRHFNGEVFYDSSWFEYNDQLINKLPSVPNLFGKNSKNLIKNARTKRPGKDYYNEYHYILNENGYIRESWINDSRTKVYFEYECE